jgi:hypothetical protein
VTICPSSSRHAGKSGRLLNVNPAPRPGDRLARSHWGRRSVLRCTTHPAALGPLGRRDPGDDVGFGSRPASRSRLPGHRLAPATVSSSTMNWTVRETANAGASTYLRRREHAGSRDLASPERHRASAPRPAPRSNRERFQLAIGWRRRSLPSTMTTAGSSGRRRVRSTGR